MKLEWNWLYVPYILNILILVPVCYQMVFGYGVVTVFENKVVESHGLRLLVASLWTAILVASIIGLAFPEFFLPIIFAQIFYKAMWLLIFSFPQWSKHGYDTFPAGISWAFVGICIIYPVCILLHQIGQDA